MSSGRNDFFTGNDGKIRRIFRQFAVRHGNIVIGDRDEGQVCLLGRLHDVSHRAAAVGSPRVNVDHSNSFTGDLTLRYAWQLDKQSFRQDSGDQQGQSQESKSQKSLRSNPWF
jgi:hypothetical protein